MSGNFIFRHHVEPIVKLYSPREESFPIPVEYIYVSRTTQTNLDVMQRSRIDGCWDIDGSRDLSGSWTGFTQFTLKDEKPPDGFLWSGKRLTKRQATSRPDRQWPELWTKLGRNAELREKEKPPIGKRPVDNAGRKRGIHFIDPEDKEIKETTRNARQKLETPVAPAMPCKTCKGSKNGETRARRLISNQNLRVSWKPANPRECERKILYQIIMRTMSQEEVTTDFNISIWYTNVFLCLKQWRYPQQKQQRTRNGKNWRKFWRGTKMSETNQRWSMKQRRTA